MGIELARISDEDLKFHVQVAWERIGETVSEVLGRNDLPAEDINEVIEAFTSSGGLGRPPRDAVCRT
jgi:type III secretory pathway lipoprotein EscJ